MDQHLPQKFYDFGFKDSDFEPSQKIRDNASKGLELRKEAPKSRKGGLTNAQASKFGIGSGVQRAVTLINDKYISWLIWGGDEAYTWSSKLVEKMKKMEEELKTKKKKKTISEHIEDLVEKYLFENFNKIKKEEKIFSEIEKIQKEI